MRGSCGSDVFKKRLVERTLDENLQQQRLLPVWAKEGSFRILIHNERTSEMRITLGELTVRTAIMAVLLIGLPGVCHAQAPDPASLVLVTSPPPHGNFWSLQGNYPPFPCDPFPQLPLFSDGTPGTYYYDASGFDFQSLRQMQMESAPTPPGLPSVGTNYSGSSGGGGSGSGGWQQANFTLNGPLDYAVYTNLWLSISNEGTTSYVTLESTLSNLTYLVFTNGDLANPSGWGLYTNLLATNNVTTVPPLNTGTNSIFFSAALVWSTCTNAYALPDWESMIEYDSLCVPSGYITNGLVAYWRLNEDGGTTAIDSSGNGVNMPLSNNPSWGSNYLKFNGNEQYGDAGSNALISLDQHDKTICAWVNQTETNYQAIVDKSYWYSGSDYAGWRFYNQNYQLNLTIEQWTLTDQGSEGVTPGQWTFVAVAWHHAYDTADFYINGILDSTVGNGAISETSSDGADLELGNAQNNGYDGALCFDGSMRDVALYNKALTSSEIQTNFLCTMLSTVNNPDLLYYKMPNGTETNPPIPFNVPDSSTLGGTNAEYLGGVSTVWTNGPDQPVGTYTAMHFDGGATTGMGGETNGSYIDTTHSTLFNFTTNLFTINLWVRPTQSPDHYIMQNCDAAFSNGWYLYVDDYNVYFSMMSNGVGKSIETPSAGAANTGVWNMLTIVRSVDTNTTIYINGLPVVSGDLPSPGPSGASLKFAVDPDSTNYYDGDIWLPQIWSSALSPVDVANLYFNQLSGSPWP
jgi:hypothetical protein